MIGCNLTYNGKMHEYGLTAVYNSFNKVLNPDFRSYNRYYPRGNLFIISAVIISYTLKILSFQVNWEWIRKVLWLV